MLINAPKLDRRARHKVSPEYEDSGLFKGGLIQVQLAMVPVFGTTSRGDCTVQALNAEGGKVTAVFAGRRRPHFQALYSQLRYMFAQAQAADSRRGVEMRPITDIQLPVQCEGAWRAVTSCDETGQERRHLQLLLARWAFVTDDGRTLHYGVAPRRPSVSDTAGAQGGEGARQSGAGRNAMQDRMPGMGWASALKQGVAI
ncbi:hypothetical protein [Phaeobacter sp. HF9A]|uniref:hypothetical protein n=1 Tax=Phaeobacter sp. HF9A TaxID=2721561 RepID=UPI0014321B38|nr:hypothetical protein [Phaeobacter sp. HF9A]NIZ12800.1 hypothetical protein [Phaeobacter sp. HF9A]